MNIIRFNRANDLLNVENEFSKFFNSFGDKFRIFAKDVFESGNDRSIYFPLADISEDQNNYKIKVDLPGIKKDDVKISFSNGQLSISGERVQEQESKDSKYHRVERAYGKYYRSFNLPKGIKEEKINAEFKDGQLTITIPKTEEAKPKEIEIKVN